MQILVSVSGSTDAPGEDLSSPSTTESIEAELGNDALSVPNNDVLDASIVSDDEEFAEGYVLTLSDA